MEIQHVVLFLRALFLLVSMRLANFLELKMTFVAFTEV